MDSAEQAAVLACVATHAIDIKYSNLKGGGIYPSSPELAPVPTSWSPRGTVVLIATTVHKTVASNPAARTHLGMYILLPGLASICSILFTCPN